MFRFFNSKEDKALRQFILAIWDKAKTIHIYDSSNAVSAKPNEQLIKNLQELISARLPWLLAIYQSAKENRRQEILNIFAKELILQPKGPDEMDYVIYPLLHEKKQLQVLLQVIDMKYKFVFINHFPLNVLKVVAPISSDNVDPLMQLKRDIMSEIQEWQQRSFIKKLDVRKLGKEMVDKMVEETIWVNQKVYYENLVAVLPDNLLRDVLAHNNKELEEEFETELVATLLEAAEKASHEENLGKTGVVLLPAGRASLPSSLFGSKEELARILQPVFNKFSNLLNNKAPSVAV